MARTIVSQANKTMKQNQRILRIVSFLIVSSLVCQTSVFAAENYALKPLFELKAGSAIDQFRLAVAPNPFAPDKGRKDPLTLFATQVLVDNSGNLYLLKERGNIVKLNPEGEVTGEIEGTQPFTVPVRMHLDGEDNFYVLFRNPAEVAVERRYAVATFDSEGDLLRWITRDEEDFWCIFFGVTINGTVFLRSCGAGVTQDQLQRYDKEGNFIGVLRHEGRPLRRRHNMYGGGFAVIGHVLTEGADGNVYVINDHDLTVKKFIDRDGNLTTTDGVEPVAEKTLFPWMQTSKYQFQGFDLDNRMYFYHRADRRLMKRVELPRHVMDVLDLSGPLRLECFRYDFNEDTYDTLWCQTVIQEEGKYAVRWALRNYAGELYELVIFFNDPPNKTPQDHARFYRWERVK